MQETIDCITDYWDGYLNAMDATGKVEYVAFGHYFRFTMQIDGLLATLHVVGQNLVMRDDLATATFEIAEQLLEFIQDDEAASDALAD